MRLELIDYYYTALNILNYINQCVAKSRCLRPGSWWHPTNSEVELYNGPRVVYVSVAFPSTEH